MTEFNPIAESITVRFTCPECGEEVESDALGVPSPNFAAENNSDSMNYDDYEIVCEHCGHCFQATIYNAMYGGEVEVEGVDDVDVEEEYSEEDDDYYDRMLYQETHTETEQTIDAIEGISEDVKSNLYRLLYANIISKMEVFLCDTIVQQVLSSDANKKKFLQTYTPLAEQQIPMKAIYSKYDALDTIIRNALTSIVYHDLKLVRKLYVNTLDVTIPENKEIEEAIQIRHDIVHRNGKDKEGNLREIKKEDVLKLAQTVADFISAIEEQLPNPAVEALKEALGENEGLPW